MGERYPRADWLVVAARLVLLRVPAEMPKREGGYVALMGGVPGCVAGQGRAAGEAEAVYQAAIPDLWRLPDALARIRVVLAEGPKGGELACFLPTIGADDPTRPIQRLRHSAHAARVLTLDRVPALPEVDLQLMAWRRLEPHGCPALPPQTRAAGAIPTASPCAG